ncbi:MAG: nuclear transport factor 2 family protein [Gemmatimonadales bacterium]|jgi:ketosteroid isomerase-like protein
MRIGICVILTVGVAMVTACQPGSADLNEQDIAALEQVIDDVTNTLLEGDHATWAGLFAEDAVIYAPNESAVKGREALRSWVAAFPPIQELAFVDRQIWGQGDYAFALSGYRYSVEGAPPDEGKQLWVFYRTEDSSWEVKALSYSSDLPIPDQQE